MFSPHKKILLAIALCSCASVCLPQEELLENFSPIDQENNEASENWLQELLAAPLNLNYVSAAELQRLPFLSQAQIAAFIVHRQREVYYTDLEQALFALQVRGDTLAFCRSLFIVTFPKASLPGKPWYGAWRSRTGVPATVEDNWIGPRSRQYHRLYFEYGEFQSGALTERDPGEPRWDDHRAANLMWQHATGRIVVGNFQTEWGLGLAQWGPYAATLAADVHAATRRWGRGITPFLSSNESRAYEGAALSQTWRRWNVLLYFSSAARDVTLNEHRQAVAYRTSGYHRTVGEIAQRDNLQEKSMGGALQYRFGIGREIGAFFQAERFNRAWQAADVRENFFDFTGPRNDLFSLAGRWQWPQHALSFEVAQSRSRGKAAALTFFQQEGMAGWTIALMHADRDFHGAHGRSLFESDEPAQAQSGYSFGLKLLPRRNMNFEFYYQRQQNLWRTRALPLPPHTGVAGFSLRWQIAGDLLLHARYAYSTNERLLQASARFLQIADGVSRYRCELEHRPAARLRLRPRLDLVRKHDSAFEAPASNRAGTALSLQITYTFSSKLVLDFRQTHFSTPLAIYPYERDLPGVFTVVALRENGIRRYIYGHLKLHANFGLAGKISVNESENLIASRGSRWAWAVQFDWSRR